MIPTVYQDLARELALLAKKYQLNDLSGTIRPGFSDREFRDDIKFWWNSGRHGAAEGYIGLQSTQTIRVEVNAPAENQGNRQAIV